MNMKWLGFSVLILLSVTSLSVASLELADPGDLGMSELSLSTIQLDKSSSRERIDIAVTVSNEGSDSFEEGAVELVYLTGKDYVSATLLQTVSLPILFPTSSVQLTASFDRNEIVGNLYAVIDPFNLFEEVDEANNKSVLILGDDSVYPSDGLNVYLESKQVLMGDIVRIRVDLHGDIPEITLLSAILSVEDTRGSVIFTSEKNILENTYKDAAETQLQWFTEGLIEGRYTLVISIVDSDNRVVNSKKLQVGLIGINSNKLPLAEPDMAYTVMDQTVGIDLAANDYEPDGNRLLYYITEVPEHGKIDELRGLVDYIPESGFVGVDHFSYQLDDSLGGSDWADVKVNVLPPEQGCTWVRNYEITNKHQDVADRGWARYPFPDEDALKHASSVLSNDSAHLFEKQPFISYPSCSLYFQPKAGVTGIATVTYVVVDSETRGKNYVSDERTFEINLLPDSMPPKIISIPRTEVEIGDTYTYAPVLADADPFQVVVLELPAFLTLSGNILQGVPKKSDIGLSKIALLIMAGDREVEQHYFLTITPELEMFPPILSDEPVISTEMATFDTIGTGPINPWALLVWFILILRSRIKLI